MHKAQTYVTAVLFLLITVCIAPQPALAQASGADCTIAGTWYGGSIASYQMTITPTLPAGHFAVTAQGMYKNSVMSTVYTGLLLMKGNRYEGGVIQLSSSDPAFTSSFPPPSVPDLNAAWSSVTLLDCNTLRNTIPFFGTYFASSLWDGTKVPFKHSPDIDILAAFFNGAPIVETYHRVPSTCAICPAVTQ